MNDPEHTTDKAFIAEARIPREVFKYVVDSIKDDAAFDLPPNVGGRRLPIEVQLMCFLLRVGAHSTAFVTARRLGISSSSVPACMRRVALAIIRGLGRKHLAMPMNGTAAKATVKATFARRQFPDAVGIIDCTHVNIVVPTHIVRDGNKNAFMNRKSRTTLTYQAITTCDSTPRFLNVSGGKAGSSYDTRVLEDSHVYQHMNEYLEGDEYLMGDLGADAQLRSCFRRILPLLMIATFAVFAGYPLRPFMMTGFKRGELCKLNAHDRGRRERFNKFFSGVRISVERAFGILKARFRSLREQFHARGDDALKAYHCVFRAACILHNVCADMKVVRALPLSSPFDHTC
jgi:hypothetical protein